MTSQYETRRMLAYVAARMGGIDQLASRLGMSEDIVSSYVTGKNAVPDKLVLQVVDLVLEGIPEAERAAN